MKPNDKGKALERAVAAIERAIVASFPGYSENTYRIECRKIVVVDGVKHEVDVWVESDPGNGYRSLFIFECKNWAGPVGKNDTIILSEKIRALGAQKGYLVAPEFTSDAKAQAEKDVRVELAYASDLPVGELNDLLGDFHIVGIEQRTAELDFIVRAPGLQREELAPSEARATLADEALNFDDFVNPWILDLVGKTKNMSRTVAGIHPLDVRGVRCYGQREMILNDQEIAEVHLHATLLLHVARPLIVSAFDVRSRGRAVILEPVGIPGTTGTLSMTIARVGNAAV